LNFFAFVGSCLIVHELSSEVSIKECLGSVVVSSVGDDFSVLLVVIPADVGVAEPVHAVLFMNIREKHGPVEGEHPLIRTEVEVRPPVFHVESGVVVVP